MEINKQNVDAIIAGMMRDPSTSYWLKITMQAALKRDPLDAATDAEYMALILKVRCEKLMGTGSF